MRSQTYDGSSDRNHWDNHAAWPPRIQDPAIRLQCASLAADKCCTFTWWSRWGTFDDTQSRQLYPIAARGPSPLSAFSYCTVVIKHHEPPRIAFTANRLQAENRAAPVQSRNSCIMIRNAYQSRDDYLGDAHRYSSPPQSRQNPWLSWARLITHQPTVTSEASAPAPCPGQGFG